MSAVGAFVRAGIAAGVSFCRVFTVETRDVDLPVVDDPCNCGAGYARAADCPWCAPDDETSSAVGLRRSHTPGEVSDEPLESPSPGALPRCAVRLDAELGIPTVSPIVCDLPAAHVGEHISYEHPDQAIIRWPRREPVEVSHEDLSAHITAIRGAWNDRWQRGGTNALTLSDEIARDLVSDYRITRK